MTNRVLYNLSVCQPEGNVKRHGGGIYGEIVLKRIIERGLPVVCYYDRRKWLNPEIQELIGKKGIHIYDVSVMHLETIINKENINLLYTPIYLNLHNFVSCHILCTIHGLRIVETPSDWFFLRYKKTIKKIFKSLIEIVYPRYFRKKHDEGFAHIAKKTNLSFVTVSEHSKYAFKSYYPESFRDIEIPVFYSPSTVPTIEERSNAYDEKYFLLVSAGIPAKNNLRAIMAFDRLYSAGFLEEYVVRVTGVNDASVYRYKLKNPNRFKFMGYVEDDTLHQLYHDAYGFVYPSLNEGFGYPPVEAMSYGVPVAASSFSSISEVCQDAAMYFNPFSVEEIMNRILQLTDSKIHVYYQEKAKRRYKEVFERQQEDLDGLIDYMYNFKVER